ncbi:MAG: protoporphyrinogen oxidase [Acidobacteria bacterium]|nr:protoporphyrinogen oxidase [Acidobacteriota bacterium]
MRRIAIVGGGISGLSAAFELERQRREGAPVEYVLFESSSRFGGVIKTERVDDCIVEAGADSFLTEKPWAADLCRELGLEDQFIGSKDHQKTSFILVNGRLRPIPDGLVFMIPTKLRAVFFSPLFSWRTKLKILREWFDPPPAAGADATVADFIERHYGPEMVERVADPLLAGIYGASARELSVAAVLPRLVDMAGKYGSLGRAMAAMRASIAGNQRPLFTSLRQGMEQMVDRLLAQIPAGACRRPGTRVEAVGRESLKWQVRNAGRTEEFDAVIVATPAPGAAELLKTIAPLAGELCTIGYSSSMMAVLGWEEAVRRVIPGGFGFLVPRGEKLRIRAVTFVHNKFPERAPPDRALIRCFLGGSGDEAILDSSEDEIRTLICRELEQMLGIAQKPLFLRIYRWKKVMARYGLGHRARIERINHHLRSLPGLALAGNAYDGIGVPDCVRSGSGAAKKVLAELALIPAEPACRSEFPETAL